jgi:low affinity Fe/Cu permease
MYQKALTDIDTYRDETVQLDSVLNARETELTAKRNYIATLLNNAKNNEVELARVKKLIDEFNNERLAFQKKIDELLMANQQLRASNDTLTHEKQSLTQKLEDIFIEKDQIIKEKEDVISENQKLKTKIDKASILTTRNLSVTPIRIKKNDKEVEVSKATDVEKLKVCFEVLENKIAPSGETELVIRIISPDGATIQTQALGSGTFVEAESGNSMPYTYKIRPDYQNAAKNICSLWSQDFKFSVGKYSCQVYQKGVLIGETSFNLK